VGLRTTGVVINNRADRLSWQAITYAQRNEAVMRAVLGFNAIMGASELAELGADVAMGVGVDLGALHPARPVKVGPIDVPGFVILKPIEKDLAEVQQIAEQAEAMRIQYEAAVAAEAAAANGGRPAAAQDAAAGG
jgi:hypothetical protein